MRGATCASAARADRLDAERFGLAHEVRQRACLFFITCVRCTLILKRPVDCKGYKKGADIRA
ncbi:hypothetical protein WM08_08455 [Burkholderia ubonensis]|uniref:hypothetical protein n=1 Tax=Burkholderia ubonensis TaxID=101571 RepID=UPI00075FF2F5|nr:hypothetical protein [Burkholderia ubonensis]KWI92418.1 hypothetical protein WM08_08455 [Burkholderia ubonensis]